MNSYSMTTHSITAAYLAVAAILMATTPGCSIEPKYREPIFTLSKEKSHQRFASRHHANSNGYENRRPSSQLPATNHNLLAADNNSSNTGEPNAWHNRRDIQRLPPIELAPNTGYNVYNQPPPEHPDFRDGSYPAHREPDVSDRGGYPFHLWRLPGVAP
jgi:hypothetical protein